MHIRITPFHGLYGRLLLGRFVIALMIVLLGFVPMLSGDVAAKDTAVVDHMVYPTGTFPDDTLAVQAAVDQGGSILLKATNVSGVPTAFDFGPADETNAHGGVFLSRDVQITGEQTGGHQTTIEGGLVPFRGYGSAITPNIRIKISGIDFEHPLLSAVIITESADSEVSGNVISDVQGYPETVCYDPPDCTIAFSFTEGRAIKFLGNGDPNNDITGRVIVNNNVIRNSHADLSAPIVFDEVAADVTIDGNQIDTTQECGVFMINSSGHVTISHNTISPGPGDPTPFSLGNGMCLVDSESRGAAYSIVDNTLDIANPNADGIILEGYGNISGAVIRGNQVTMHDTYYGAVTMIDNVSNALVANNRIRGTAAFALDVLQFDTGVDAGSNTFQGNDLATFDATVADLYLDSSTHDTVLVGHTDTVVNLGVNNHVTGVTPMGGAAIGHQIAQAEVAREVLNIRGFSGKLPD